MPGGVVTRRELSIESLKTLFPPIASLIDDEEVTEIMILCARGDVVLVFYEKGGQLYELAVDAATRGDVERLCYAIARPLGLDPTTEPIGDARLEDGSRVAYCVEPASAAPALTVRRFSRVVFSAAELVSMGSLPPAVLDALRGALAVGGNVLVAGGTGSGKTTLLNALIKMFPPDRRLVVIEDTMELRVTQRNTVRLEARDVGEFKLTIRDMVRHALRHRPDHIVVGEIRGAEAQDVLQALNTGHGGSLTTIHANTARDALSRMAVCAMQAEMALPWDVICRNVASAFRLVVHQHRRPDRSRGISELLRVRGYDAVQRDWLLDVLWREDDADAVGPAADVPPVAARLGAGGPALAEPSADRAERRVAACAK